MEHAGRGLTDSFSKITMSDGSVRAKYKTTVLLKTPSSYDFGKFVSVRNLEN